MDGANADSDHSMTWEDFFGSTSDLTPTLIGIYDSLLKPAKAQKQELSRFDFTPKDARNNPPLDVTETSRVMIEETKDVAKDIEIIAEADIPRSPPKDPSKIAGSVKLPMVNKSSLYSLRTKVESDTNGANDNVSCLTSSDSTISLNKTNVKTFKFQSKVSDTSTFDNLSPNVKRMISSASETTANQLKFQKKTSASAGRASIRGHKSNIPLVGATSKITQSGVEILPSVDIYDQPHGPKVPNKTKIEEQRVPLRDSSSKTPQLKPEFKLDVQETYDVPTNNRPAIYDVPVNKTAFESLSLPFIDQSIELSITSDDREFDVKVASKDNSPEKALPTQEASPTKTPTVSGTNSLNRKDFGSSPVKQLSKTDPYPEAIGSTGNLKSIAIPEKEVPRLNPPSVEVSRPLSMSSIASSSSTSSSGAQNKGGVNSAYLASIESLDDHSDADMISANGSNNFVNNAGVKGVSEDRDNMPRDQNEEVSGLSQLERVCAEIIHTENVYVRDLQQVVEGYLHIWRKESTFSVEELSELFNNIEDIYSFNRSLCEELNTCRLDATCIARCFVNNTSGFSVYTRYCTGYPATMERLAALASTAESARQFRERQLALGHPLPLASYLLKPVQRILKYHLLLQNVVKQCASRETEFALLKMTGIAQHIDDMKRRHEHAVRVQEIQSLLYGWNGPDLTTYGELCAEGTFRVFGAKAMRHAFLFDKMLLVTKNREDGILAYKSHIMCNNMMLVESIAGAPLSFHVIPWDAPRAQLTLRARSPRHKREWTLLLKRVILENYNAVIPSHARQLVMELGQNKTDDDMLAEKSHNLITQASMRKQLSAPEYLEKRKLERERRKSFENGIRGRLKKSNRKYTVPNSRHDHQEDCDCLQFSTEKGIDYTCDNCYIDLCSDCEVELSSKTKPRNDKCTCRNDDNNELDPEKCPECDRSLHYIDSGSAEHLERKPSICKCSDFKSSQESVGKEFPNSLNKTRGYHSSDNIVGYTDSKSKENIADATNCSMTSVRVLPKTCLKCTKIKENIPVTDSTSTLISRKSRSNDTEKNKQDTLRSKSRDDPQRSKLSKIGTWRRKSEPGLQQNNVFIGKRQDTETERAEPKGNEKIEFECRNCGSNKISKKSKSNEVVIISDPELENRKRGISAGVKSNVEIKMYNTKNIPKKISKLKKNRTKGFRLGSDTTAKFYADFPTDISTENILHISESNDSLNIENTTKVDQQKLTVPGTVSKDEDIDEETYKKLIEKTDSFKKNELEKVKYLNQQKVINEGSEAEIDKCVERSEILDIEDCDVSEQPLEQIISQLLLQNREFQKLLKKQQQRHSAQRRHQRLLKSHSNPEQEAPPKNDVDKMRPKYVRSISENLDAPVEEIKKLPTLSPPNEVQNETDDDHIYETLRVETKADENLHTLNSKSKSIQHNTRINRPVRLPSPPNLLKNKLETKPRISTHESDYVYLSFDKLNKVQDEINAIYDVPVKSPEKVDNVTKPQDYYVIIEKKDPIITVTEQEVEDIYDSIIEVCRRKKEITVTGPGEYLPMGLDKKNPNTPEIWLSRQKEHFNVSHDRKSGSLPRSFQIVTNNPEDANVSSFKCKPNTNSKTYLNRDGKVVSTDRPFTIASDKSEISYDDVENYMSEGDVLKFNKTTKSNDSDYLQDISQSTLELEEEIDRCYRVNFEKMNLDSNKNESLAVSQPNLNTSTTSSCEVLPAEKSTEIDTKDIEVVHPEHKIYKPTSNMLSLKNVLSRFKTRNPNKSDDNNEINANEQSSPDSAKSDLKSPTNEKKPALNPRSYSKNLLQRFRNIIGDEQPDDNENRPYATLKTKKAVGEAQNKQLKSEIKVVVTSTDVSSTSTSVSTGNNDILSKSVCETTTLTESQNEKNNPDNIFYSCDNISQKSEIVRPGYEKSVSLITTRSSSIASSTASPIRSNNSSFQSLNKLPIYMQGSKHMGAKIAQSDYVDPSSLMHENSSKNINILINKNAVRPDSLFSNLSFVTTSSDGVHHETPPKTSFAPSEDKSSNNAKSSDSCAPINSDESCYEKSFEKIEQVTDEDIFRDSAVYSDHEDIETDSAIKTKGKSVSRIESIKRSFKTHNMSIATSVTEKTSFHSRVTFTTKDIQQKEKVTTNTERKSLGNEKTKTKIAPPVPVKPKLSHSPSSTNLSTRTTNIPNYNLKKTQEHAFSNESIDTKSIKRNTTMKQTYLRSESTPTEDKKNQRINIQKNKETHSKLIGDATKIDAGDNNAESKNSNTATTSKLKSPASNIQIKRLSFERASLDSATRKIKVTNATDNKRQSMDNQNPTSKSVLERRLEIESMSKSQTTKTNATSIKKPSQIAKPKSISTKMATFERSVSESEPKDVISTSIDKPNIPSNENSIIEEPKDDEPRGSWVKTVVNKFQ